MEQSTKFFNQIPVPIIEADDLNDFEKLLFSEIYTMANSFGSVFPSNNFLADRYGKSKKTISVTLKSLQEKEYIKLEYEYEGKEVKRRYILPYLHKCKGGTYANVNTPIHERKEGIYKNVKDNISTNKSINKSNNNISDKSDIDSDLEKRFDNLWKIYPNKKGKPRAFAAYKKAIKTGTTDELIKAGIENYLAEIKAKNTQKSFIKHGSTWFNGKGWEDDYDLSPTQYYKNNKAVKGVPQWSNAKTLKDREYMSDEEVEALINGLGDT